MFMVKAGSDQFVPTRRPKVIIRVRMNDAKTKNIVRKLGSPNDAERKIW
jgi:hypothetical protein